MPGGIFAALAAQIALNVYQSVRCRGHGPADGLFPRHQPFSGRCRGVVGALRATAGENGEQQEILARMEDSRSTCNAWLWRVEAASIVWRMSARSSGCCTAQCLPPMPIMSTCWTGSLPRWKRTTARRPPRLYYDQVAACGDYLSQYTLQLLETAILDAQTSYTELSVLSARIGMLETVVVGLCVALGCVSAMMVMQLLTPVQQMIAASWAIARSEFDSPDIPLPRGLEMASWQRRSTK